MAYNYLSLTNDVCRMLNEVELTSVNFTSAIGQHGLIKDSINYAIKDINQNTYEWPFNHTTQTDTLVAGTNRYSFPSNYKTSSMDTFRIKRSTTFGNETKLLVEKAYEEYLRTFIDQEYNTSDTGIRKIPEYIFKTPSLEYIVAPVPDNAYELVYEYYQIPADLINPTDVPTIPEQFRKTIINGAMYYNYLFRSDVENTQMSKLKFDSDLKSMENLFITRHAYIKSTMIERKNNSKINERIQ